MVLKKDNKYLIECKIKIATDCTQNGNYCDSEDEAEDWVETECWIDSGEGWICNKCHDKLMGNLRSHRHEQGHGLDGMNYDLEGSDGLDNELEGGIDTVR